MFNLITQIIVIVCQLGVIAFGTMTILECWEYVDEEKHPVKAKIQRRYDNFKRKIGL